MELKSEANFAGIFVKYRDVFCPSYKNSRVMNRVFRSIPV
jgi:hypothetical protein